MKLESCGWAQKKRLEILSPDFKMVKIKIKDEKLNVRLKVSVNIFAQGFTQK